MSQAWEYSAYMQERQPKTTVNMNWTIKLNQVWINIDWISTRHSWLLDCAWRGLITSPGQDNLTTKVEVKGRWLCGGEGEGFVPGNRMVKDGGKWKSMAVWKLMALSFIDCCLLDVRFRRSSPHSVESSCNNFELLISGPRHTLSIVV